MPPILSLSQMGDFLGVKPLHLDLEGIIQIRDSPRIIVPFRYVENDDSSRLIACFNGAVDRKAKPQGIVFQRSSWAVDFPSSVLFLSDPSLIGNGISLGWGQISRELDFGPIAAQIVSTAAATLRNQSGPTVYFGSSAGGYQAMSAAAYDPNSVCLVNNAQFNWLLYDVRQSVADCVQHLGFKSVDEIPPSFAPRVSILEQIRTHRQSLRVRYLLNTSSPNDFAIQRRVFDELRELLRDDPSSWCDLEQYQDSAAGHNPLPKAALMNEMLRMLTDTSYGTKQIQMFTTHTS